MLYVFLSAAIDSFATTEIEINRHMIIVSLTIGFICNSHDVKSSQKLIPAEKPIVTLRLKIGDVKVVSVEPLPTL